MLFTSLLLTFTLPARLGYCEVSVHRQTIYQHKFCDDEFVPEDLKDVSAESEI